MVCGFCEEWRRSEEVPRKENEEERRGSSNDPRVAGFSGTTSHRSVALCSWSTVF